MKEKLLKIGYFFVYPAILFVTLFCFVSVEIITLREIIIVAIAVGASLVLFELYSSWHVNYLVDTYRRKYSKTTGLSFTKEGLQQNKIISHPFLNFVPAKGCLKPIIDDAYIYNGLEKLDHYLSFFDKIKLT